VTTNDDLLSAPAAAADQIAAKRFSTQQATTEQSAPARSRFSLTGLWAWALEMSRFLVVGGVSFVVDMGLFNLLVFGPGHVLGNKTTTANVIAIAVATLVSWVGNRHWTFASKRTDRQLRELLVYGAINVVAALVPVATVAMGRYTFHQDSQLALNAAKVIGIVLGTAIRYVGYKLWVFTGGKPDAAEIAATQL
jgi:putative flippase GtrA